MSECKIPLCFISFYRADVLVIAIFGIVVDSDCDHAVNILPDVMALKEEMIVNRRWFHQYPELSFEEYQTAAKVAEHLRAYGIEEVFENVGKTGVVGIIRGSHPGKCIALRADMDALPLHETADIPFRSVNANVMHACGHDGHMSSLLAAAKILYSKRHMLQGVVKLIFQPAEEGYHGAREMIKDGVLEDGPFGPSVDAIYGIHLWSYFKLGTIGCESGPIMAASDRFTIKVKGSGGHGAAPQGTVDAIVEAAAVVQNLQTIVSRNLSPLDSGVITCGTISGGYGYNIIADDVTITGTCRSFTPAVQELMRTRMCEVCCGVARCYGGDINVDYAYGYPPTVNAYPECNEVVRNAAAKIVGLDYCNAPQKTMGAEDFSYFLLEKPGCFFFVGAALPGDLRPHHKSVFDFDENAMLVSASMFVQIIDDLLLASEQ